MPSMPWCHHWNITRSRGSLIFLWHPAIPSCRSVISHPGNHDGSSDAFTVTAWWVFRVRSIHPPAAICAVSLTSFLKCGTSRFLLITTRVTALMDSNFPFNNPGEEEEPTVGSFFSLGSRRILIKKLFGSRNWFVSCGVKTPSQHFSFIH